MIYLQSLKGKSALTVTIGNHTLLFSQGILIAIRTAQQLYVLNQLPRQASHEHIRLFKNPNEVPHIVPASWFKELALTLPIKQ